jgi:hypothetical protein
MAVLQSMKNRNTGEAEFSAATKAVLAAVLAAGISGLSEARAQSVSELPDYGPFYAERPFVIVEARTAFQDYINRLSIQFNRDIHVPPDFWDSAPLTEYWGYSFAKNSTGTYDVTFEQKFDADQIIRAVINAINSVSADDCSYFNAENASVASIDNKRIVVVAGISGTARACVGGWNTDVGDISGTVVGSVTFKTDPTQGNGRYKGQVIADTPNVHIDLNVDIFGISSNSVAGQIVTAITSVGSFGLFLSVPGVPSVSTAWGVMNVFDSNLYRVSGNSLTDGAYLKHDNGSVDSASYRDFLQEIHSLTWSIQPSFEINDSKTGFSLSPAGKWIFTVAFTATLKSWEFIDTVAEDANAEVELIKSFSAPKINYKAVKGDTLWAIAKRFYGNEFYFHMLAAANNKDVRKANYLRIGEILSIPPLHALAPVPGLHFVVPGETISELCNKLMPGNLSRCKKAIYKKNPSIRSGRLYALERIVIPP